MSKDLDVKELLHKFVDNEISKLSGVTPENDESPELFSQIATLKSREILNKQSDS